MEEYEDYAKQIAALVPDYPPADSERPQQFFQQGKPTIGSMGAPGVV
jgi:hypothetical protein